MSGMTDDYRPFRDIRSVEDLLLVRERLAAAPARLRLPADAYYPEVCVWLTFPGGTDVFAAGGRTLLAATATDSIGWRLLLTEHGYLRFEADGEDGPACESIVPVHSALDPVRDFRLGVSIGNYGWSLRGTKYAAEASSYARVRLLAAGRDGPLSEIGGLAEPLPIDLAPVPEELEVAEGVTEIAAYNAEKADRLAAGGVRPADDLLPLVPGGSSFGPRWIDERTAEVFTRPEFTRTSSYWVFLRVEDSDPMPERLLVHTTWRGGTNMTPTFFAGADRRSWRRVAPVRVHVGPGGTDFAAEFDARKLAGQWLASAPPFGDEERAALLPWARRQPDTEVREIGASVEGRPIHLIRVGAQEDGAAPHGVVLTCGQHSPLEIMTGRLIEPMIRRILERPGLLEACTFWFVPTVNVDCAHYGGNGLNANRRNLNRHWFADLQPETTCAIELLESLREAGQRIDLGIDLHAGGTFRNHILMHMGATDEVVLTEEALARQEVWRDLLAKHAGLRRADGWALPQQRLRASDYLHQACGATGFCLEMSSCSYFDPRTQQTREFGQEAFAVLAAGIVSACEERFLT